MMRERGEESRGRARQRLLLRRRVRDVSLITLAHSRGIGLEWRGDASALRLRRIQHSD